MGQSVSRDIEHVKFGTGADLVGNEMELKNVKQIKSIKCNLHK